MNSLILRYFNELTKGYNGLSRDIEYCYMYPIDFGSSHENKGTEPLNLDLDKLAGPEINGQRWYGTVMGGD